MLQAPCPVTHAFVPRQIPPLKMDPAAFGSRNSSKTMGEIDMAVADVNSSYRMMMCADSGQQICGGAKP